MVVIEAAQVNALHDMACKALQNWKKFVKALSK